MRTDGRGATRPPCRRPAARAGAQEHCWRSMERTETRLHYRHYLAPGGVRYQAEPPVCNSCGHGITRQNFGRASLFPSAADAREQVEWIECRACTPIRQIGPPLRHFMALHHL
jgi:hypothetical protein